MAEAIPRIYADYDALVGSVSPADQAGFEAALEQREFLERREVRQRLARHRLSQQRSLPGTTT